MYYRGLILVAPHGSLIHHKNKTLIVKSKRIKTIVNHPLLLIENKIAYGLICLGEPKLINIKQFDHLRSRHCITEEERTRWWGPYQSLYAYDIIATKMFRIPLLLDYVTGPQITVRPENIHFNKIYIGTAGYVNKNIETDLNMVEINYTFYRYPTKSFISKLAKRSIRYCLKVHQQITHYHKLHQVAMLYRKFSKYLSLLSDKLVCILFQFPTHFTFGSDTFMRLVKLAKFLQKKYVYAFEFRHISWFNNDRVNKLFKANGWTLVITHVNNETGWADDLNTGFNPLLKSYVPTTDLIYLRLHGTIGQYVGSYHAALLNEIVTFSRTQNVQTMVVCFNNTADQSAYHDAIKLIAKFNPLNTLIDD